MTSVSPENSLPVARLKHFQLIRLVGQGPFSAIYEAQDLELDRLVAIKLLNAELASVPALAKRFISQAAAAARVLHPNIVQIYYVGEESPYCFCVREFVTGTSLEGRLAAGELFSEFKILAIVAQILQALATLESLGMRHGNLHARNVLFDQTYSRTLLSDLEAASEISPRNITPQPDAVEIEHINPDLESVGQLLRRMVESNGLPNVTTPDTPLISSPIEPEWKEEFQLIIRRLSPGGDAVPFHSLPEALTAIETLLKNYLEYHGTGEAKAITNAPTKIPDAGAVVNPGSIFEFQETNVELPGHLFNSETASLWQQCRQWLSLRLGLRAPASVDEIKDTHAAVDGAIAELQRRFRALDRLTQEGEVVLLDLEERRDHRLEADFNHSKADADALSASVTEQQRHLDEIRRRKSELDGSIERLIRQRDVLNARLRAAESRGAKRAPAETSVKKTSKLAFVAQLALIVSLFCYAGYLVTESSDFKQFWAKFRAAAQLKMQNAKWYATQSSITNSLRTPWIPIEMAGTPLRPLRGSLEQSIHSVAFCPGRSVVAGASMDGTMRIWSADTGQQLKHYANIRFDAPHEVCSAIFSPDGRQVILGLETNSSGQGLMQWDLATGRALKYMQGAMNGIRSSSITSDGQTLAVVAHDRIPGESTIFKGNGTVVLFDMKTGQLIERLPTDGVNVTHVKCSPQGTLVAFIGGAAPVQIWDTAQKKIVHSLTGHGTPLGCLAFSPDGRKVAAGGTNGRVSIWTLGSDDRPEVLISSAPHPSPVKDLEFNPDGRVLATIGGGFSALWDHASQKVIRYFIIGHTDLAFSSDGRFLVTSGWDNGLKGWSGPAPMGQKSPPLIWDTSDLGTLLRQPPATAVQSRESLTSTARFQTEAEALRFMRYLCVTDLDRPHDWQASIKAAAPSFTKVDVEVGDTAAKWQEVTLNRSKAGIDGIRFSSPLHVPADLHWSFNPPLAMDCWMIASPAGPIEHFKSYRYEYNLDIPELPISENNIIFFQPYEGGHILPGREYVIWFRLETQDPVKLRFALHLRQTDKTRAPAELMPEIAKAMGWSGAFQLSSVPHSQVDLIYLRQSDPFNFQPRLPFSKERYPAVEVRHYSMRDE